MGRCGGLPSRGKIRGYHRRGGKIVVPGKGGSILIYVGNNNAERERERESITVIVEKYRQLARTVK